MKYAKKTKKKFIQAYCLGEDTPVERQLLLEGAIQRLSDDTYELFSQEAVNGHGEIARRGDFFKVDTKEEKHYPYPNTREFFLKNHRHISGDEYEQISKPLPVWQYGDDISEEISWLLAGGKLVLDPDNPEKFFNAFLWGANLSAGQDATVVFYSVERASDGTISDISFNFVAKKDFDSSYELCNAEA